MKILYRESFALEYRRKKLSRKYYYNINHNYNKILKSDWLSTAPISALIGQLNRTVRVMLK